MSPNTIREAFQMISAADRVLSGVSSAGKQILSDLSEVLDTPEEEVVDGETHQIEADPAKAGGQGPSVGSNPDEVGPR